MADTTFSVSGMTCEHCSKAVSAELGELEGVREVSIELVPGGTSTVRLEGEPLPEQGAIAEAVAEAGDYTVAF
ncbi:copper chaperone CopZ [Kineosphaera limosa]|uniref:Copper chaperone CopZ n=1 Tax=Kineosphaera limosa NBRC 100340 TaxID=1184609 RepID=K6WBT7_9MICO|nr:heavy-metal-associated domain-containing protein [Kineosphaera limosa]NYE01543.1 copper chaperone CopZ [Kineosphaera limosa]GAB96700.1 copper chaperone CopZ [Kineosphaera limosa NBRC 100340]